MSLDFFLASQMQNHFLFNNFSISMEILTQVITPYILYILNANRAANR